MVQYINQDDTCQMLFLNIIYIFLDLCAHYTYTVRMNTKNNGINNKKVKLNLTLSHRHRDILRTAAVANGVSVSEIVRNLVNEMERRITLKLNKRGN